MTVYCTLCEVDIPTAQNFKHKQKHETLSKKIELLESKVDLFELEEKTLISKCEYLQDKLILKSLEVENLLWLLAHMK